MSVQGTNLKGMEDKESLTGAGNMAVSNIAPLLV